MSWHDDNYNHRRPLSIIVGSTTPTDVTIAMSADDEQFWAGIRSDCNDIRVCDADGRTLETYDIASFDYANRVLTVEVDNATFVVSKVNVLWLYFGYSSATAANTTFSPSSPVTGYAEFECPDPAYIVPFAPERAGATIPQPKIAKSESEIIWVYFDIESAMIKRDVAYESHALYEEPSSWTFGVYNSGGSVQAAMVTQVNERLIECNGRRYIRCEVKAGSSGSDYTGRLDLTTSKGRVLQANCLIQVRTPTSAG